MATDVNRRKFFVSAGLGAAAAAALTQSASAQEGSSPMKVLGVACSPRKGKTTAQALHIALDAAKEVAPDRVNVELVELAGLKIPGELAAGIPLEAGERDDFPMVAEKLSDPSVAAILERTLTYQGVPRRHPEVASRAANAANGRSI